MTDIRFNPNRMSGSCLIAKNGATTLTKVATEVDALKVITPFPVMKTLPGGTFEMGDDEIDSAPRNTVSVSSFEIAETDITQAQFIAIMGFNDSHFKGENRPVENVSWCLAQEYCLRLSLQKGIATSIQKTKLETLLQSVWSGRGSAEYKAAMTAYNAYVFSAEGKTLYRLPTEAEWEYAAKGGKQHKYGTNDGTRSEKNTVFHQNETSNVKSKPANPFGLYDMAGNVWQWCADTYESNYYKSKDRAKKDPVNLNFGDFRALRGGAWGDGLGIISSSAARYFYIAWLSNIDFGFRPARTVK